ncbi:MAG: hypothetical protein KIT31_04175 [Deltaproteobacteria bacterium]|nr:hypothetical protein [Deltaproteobacteria bacterium]
MRLRSAGAEPRRALRYRPVAGVTYDLALGMSATMRMTSAGHHMYGRDGDSRTRLSLHVASVAPGAIAIDVTVHEVVEPRFDPGRGGRASLDGLRGTFTMDERGVLASASASLASSSVRDQLYLLDYLHAFPAEPVGVGATWEIDQIVTRTGITMRSTQTYRLEAIDGDRIRTSMTEVQDAPPQLVPALAYEALSVFENLTMRGGGSAEQEIALDMPYPVAMTARFEFTDEMRIHRPFWEPQPVALMMRGTAHGKLTR